MHARKTTFILSVFFLLTIAIYSPTVTAYNTSKFGESGIVSYVVDGDTFDVDGVGRVRLADVNCPEMDTDEGVEAKSYVSGLISNEKVYLDIDDIYETGPYDRIIAVVYIPYNSTHLIHLNQLLVQNGYAVITDYDNEFNPSTWNNPPPEIIKDPSIQDSDDDSSTTSSTSTTTTSSSTTSTSSSTSSSSTSSTSTTNSDSDSHNTESSSSSTKTSESNDGNSNQNSDIIMWVSVIAGLSIIMVALIKFYPQIQPRFATKSELKTKPNHHIVTKKRQHYHPSQQTQSSAEHRSPPSTLSPSRITQSYLLQEHRWTAKKRVQTKNGPRYVQNFIIPTTNPQFWNQFWDLWGRDKATLKEQGISVSKYKGQWQISKWSNITD